MSLVGSGCKRGDNASNQAPVSNAGSDQSVTLGTDATLDGGASNDPENSTLTFSWSVSSAPDGATSTFSDATISNPSFNADTPGTYILTLTVSDGALSATDTVTITITEVIVEEPDEPPVVNEAPVANAGDDQSGITGRSNQLSGRFSYDPEDAALSYLWSITSAPSGSSATFTDASIVNPRFTPDVVGSYTLSLVVNDNNSDSSADSLLLSVLANTAPVANAGEDKTVTTGGRASLSGAASSDAELDPLNYTWSLASAPGGSTSTLSNANVVNPTFIPDLDGSYVFNLNVSDGLLSSTDDSVTISSATPVSNTAPVANAGADKAVATGSQVELDGSQSSDADDDSLSYFWSLTSSPSDSKSSLTDPNTASPSFIADVDGTYTLSLVVNDGQADSTADNLSVSATTNTWTENTEDTSNFIITDGVPAPVNIQSTGEARVGSNFFFQIETASIPDYQFVITQDQVDFLNTRPLAASDFVGGVTSAVAGDTIEFGENIGYDSEQCSLGYWPPGPECPSIQTTVAQFLQQPEAISGGCPTTTGAMGFMFNGTALYNWSNGSSYNNQGIWHDLAPQFELYDFDLCQGHANPEGEYHHHSYSDCLANAMNDNANGHSPIYGLAADGYPIHGPWHAATVLTKSAWRLRDYDTPDPTTGCAVAGERTCLLVNQYDISQGTVATANPGPTTSTNVSTNSGNTIVASAGVYFEDFYYDPALTASSEDYLDDHNGHDHDELGYHYHITVTEDGDGNLEPSFPYQIGPTFYGATPAGSIYTCTTH